MNKNGYKGRAAKLAANQLWHHVFHMRKRNAYRIHLAVVTLAQLVELAALIGIVLVVLRVAFLSAKEEDLATYEQTPALILGAVLCIAAHIFFERVVAIPERKRDSVKLRQQLAAIRRHMGHLTSTNESLRQYIRAAGHYIQLQDLRSRAQSRNPQFTSIAEESLRESFLLLERLSQGRIDVPENEISSTMALLISAYRERIDAVSNEDLDFWLGKDPVADDYRRHNRSAIRAGALVSRIFIIRLKDLDTNIDVLRKVLCDQYELGVSWGICVAEEFDSDIRHIYNVRFDFALFNQGRAVSYFRKTPMRRFETVFSTGQIHHENDREILRQMILYSKLAGECWMVTACFQDNFAGAFSEENTFRAEDAVSSVLHRGRAHNKLLIAALGEDLKIEGDPFVLVVRSPEEIEPKLRRLAQIIEEYRQ